MKSKFRRLFHFFSGQIPKARCMGVQVSCLFFSFLLLNCGFSPVLLANLATTGNIGQNVQGIVKDKEEKPLEGATVTIKGTSVGTQTDRRGEFTFPNLEKGSVLVVTFTGYLSKEVTLVDQTRVEIILEEDPEALGDYVRYREGSEFGIVKNCVFLKSSNDFTAICLLLGHNLGTVSDGVKHFYKRNINGR